MHKRYLHFEMKFVNINVFPASLKPTKRMFFFGLRFRKTRMVSNTMNKLNATEPINIQLSKPGSF